MMHLDTVLICISLFLLTKFSRKIEWKTCMRYKIKHKKKLFTMILSLIIKKFLV
ncbi:hypothetical protein HanIR_Chr10g0455651 [Helianthus annuus]|nr:hypothetical protein HanIR_Chr10g0455651 [Helianthus annuus]